MGRVNIGAGTLLAPLPAVMVSVGDMERSNIITVGWTGILSTHPARVYISVRPERHSHSFLGVGREFVINLTTEALAEATDFSGIYTGAKVDKFEKLGLHKIPSKSVLAPTVAESPLALECRICEVMEMGTHDVFIADIVNATADESIIDADGKIRLDRAALMAYAHGEYYALGKVLGKFGMSTDKKKRLSASDASGKKPSKRASHGVGEKKPFGEREEKTKPDGRDKTGEPFYIGALKYKKRRGGK